VLHEQIALLATDDASNAIDTERLLSHSKSTRIETAVSGA
jgi:hypothetical protein